MLLQQFFLFIQLVLLTAYINFFAEPDNGGDFLVYNRWESVGVKGQDKIHGPFKSCESAIQEFEQKFLAKTKNAWSSRNNFVCYPKSYAWLEMDYSGKKNESTVSYMILFLLLHFSFSSCNLMCLFAINSGSLSLDHEISSLSLL